MKAAPVGYKQQYRLHVYFGGITYPCVYALLPGNNEEMYNKMLYEVLQLIPPGLSCNPVTVTTGFEKAAVNAFQRNFPRAEVALSFHLASLSADASRILVSRHGTGRCCLRHPGQEVPGSAICSAGPNDGLLEFAKYFQETYVGQQIHGGMEIPGKFPHQTWNKCQRVKDDLPRTKNALES